MSGMETVQFVLFQRHTFDESSCCSSDIKSVNEVVQRLEILKRISCRTKQRFIAMLSEAEVRKERRGLKESVERGSE